MKVRYYASYHKNTVFFFFLATCSSTSQLWLQRTGWGLAAIPQWKGDWPCTQLPESPYKWHLLRGPYEIKKARLLSAHIITLVNCTNQQCFQHKDSLGVASREEQKKIPTQQCCHRQVLHVLGSLGMHPHLWLGNTVCSRKHGPSEAGTTSRLQEGQR